MPSTNRTHLEQMLSQRQKELATAQNLVRQLSEQCLHIRREINTTTPIMLLPLELKVYIFCLSKHEDSDDADDPIALLLGAVCNEWRAIVLNTPQLWDTILIPFYNQKTGQDMQLNQAKLSTLQEWLARGKEGPLSVQVVLRNSMGEKSPKFPGGGNFTSYFFGDDYGAVPSLETHKFLSRYTS